MSKQIKLTIPQVPLSTNEIKSLMWTNYGKVQLREIRDMWIDEVWVEFCLAKRDFDFPLSLPMEKAKITIKIFFRTDAHRDHDNFQCKEVIDAIRHNGLIEDDDYDHIGKTDVDITGRDRKYPRTEITIVEVKKGG